MGEVGSIFVRIGAKIDDFEAAMRRVQSSIKEIENRFDGMRAVGDRISEAGQKVVLAGGAMAAGLGFAVKTAADFEAQMSKVKALSGATEADFTRLRDAAIELGAQSVYSASEAAQGMQILAAAGFDTNQIIAAMPGLLNAAAAAGEDFATVADIMVAAMSGFGLQAQDMAHIADVLASAANASAISITDIGYSLKYVAPVATTAGVSLEEVSAALAILGNAGIKADQAGTTLRMALIRLADPPKEAAAMMEQLGIKVTDASGKMLPFQQIIAQLHEKFRGLSQAQRIQAAATIFGAESMSGMLTLIEAGPEKLGALTTEFQNSSGAAQQMADTMTNNLWGALEQLKGSLESAFITVGTALTPTIQTITQHLQGLVDWFNQLPAPVQQGIAIFGALAAVLAVVGGTVLIFSGLIMQGITALSSLASLLSALPAVFTAITGPIGLVIAAIAALAAIAYIVYKNWGPIKEFFAKIWEWIKDKTLSAWETIKNSVVGAWEAISGAASTIWGAIKSTITDIVQGVVDNVLKYYESMKDGIEKVWNGIADFFRGAWDLIKNIFGGALLLILDLVTGDFTKLKEDAVAIWNNIKDALGKIWDGIKQIFSGSLEALKGFLTTTWNNIKTTAEAIWTGIKNFLSNTWENIKSTAINAWNSLKSSVSNAMDSVRQAIVDAMNRALDFLRNLPSTMYNLGVDIIKGLLNGISSLAGRVWQKVNEIADGIKQKIRGALGIASPSRVMIEFGRLTGEGLAIGLKQAIASVEKQALSLVNMAVLSPDVISLASDATYNIKQQNSSSSVPAPVEIIIQQMVVRSEEDIYAISRQLYQLSRSQFRAYGQNVRR